MAIEKLRLLLLPGLDGTGLLFAPLLAALPAGVRAEVLRYPCEHPLTLAQHADVVEQAWPADGRVVLLAESFSGLVALQLMQRRPPRLAGLLCVAAFAEPPRPWLLQLATRLPGSAHLARGAPDWLLRHACVGREADAATLALLRQALARVAPAVIAHRLALLRSVARPPAGPAGDLPPLRYLQALGDRLVPRRSAGWFQAHWPGCRVDAIDGPHFLLQARPGACARWVSEALATMV
ncbi:alpha/beta fold hydrolase [Eleftheria terrae]|uniref:alpha/beta fold hydrolase n=1 Tax=Eleftheria terrae TaxID=1597781 RepID=UPI00263B388E|nr:alpha/beta fold hydrolase [Eleftheria terrae]WKB51271.1 lysophospholipase [Eleftheria terrae]